jgi:hypothetical protein
MIHEKTLSQKSHDTVPLKRACNLLCEMFYNLHQNICNLQFEYKKTMCKLVNPSA